jgi:hypothetical protein
VATDDELLAALGAALEPGHREPPEAGVEALRRAVEAAQVKQAPVVPVRAGRRRVAAVAVAVAAALVGFGGAQVVERLRTGTGGGVEEFAVRVRSDDGRRQAEVEGTRVGEGRVIRLKSDDLPILPKGEFYEVWFVGPGDSPASPNRVSAGTFHPDDQGRTRIVLFGAVDPKKLPVLEITAEPGDGNPLPSGPAVLRTQLVVRG